MYEKVPNVLSYELCKEVMKEGRRERGRRDASSHLTSPSLKITGTSLPYYSISEVGIYSFKEVLTNAGE